MSTTEIFRAANSAALDGQLAALRLMDSAASRLATSGASRPIALRWVWVVLIGILVIAAAAAFIYCRSAGYSGFTGNIEFVRGPFGVKIGIKIGCY